MSSSPEAPQTAGEMLKLARAFLGRRELEEARLEAELLVAHALSLDRLGLFLQLDRPVSTEEVDAARALLLRRARREPVAYLTGKREFYGRDIAVGPGVLVPRPETELVVDLARDRLAARCTAGEELRLADLGTGSGCLAITLALELEGSRVVASDVSPRALVWAAENARRLGAEVELVLGDGPEALLPHAPFDALVSNPPYVLPAERDTLTPEVRDHEPAEALFVEGGDPDRWIRRIATSARDLVVPDGFVLIELGAGQSERACAVAREAGFHEPRLHGDLARIPRVLELEVATAER